MDISLAIKNRRSIKSYLDKKVSIKDVCKIIEAGTLAPNAGSIENWRFIAVQNPDTKQKIAKACINQLWMSEAPIHIVVCSDSNKLNTLYKKRSIKFARENCAAAIENMLLTATSLKLATCWVGMFDSAKIKSLLSIDSDVKVIAVITLGYGAEKPISKRQDIDRVLYFETYGNKNRDTSFFPISKHFKK